MAANLRAVQGPEKLPAPPPVEAKEKRSTVTAINLTAVSNLTTVRPEVSPGPPPDTGKWSKMKAMGRYMLLANCQVPTTFIQSQGGVVRSGDLKGEAAKHQGQTFHVSEVNVKAILIAIAMWDLNGDSQTNFPSNGLLAHRTGMKISTVNGAIRVLTQAGWIWKTPRGNITNSKYCHVNWGYIEANQVSYVPEQKTFEGYRPPGYKADLPTPAPEPRLQPQAKPDPIILNALVNAVRLRLEKYDPAAVLVPTQAIEPVLKPLLKQHNHQAILAVIKSLEGWQWGQVSKAKNPAGFMTVTLTNALAGMTVDQVRELRARDEDDEDE